MTATCTDLFCGAGGSSLGAETAGLQLVMAANHWQTAIDVHQAHFPEADHDCADVREADPRRYPVTDVLLASPECTNHSQARGVSRKRQDPTLWDAPDPSAERSRATMWTPPHFAEQNRYAAVVVENVVEATRWVGWHAWLAYWDALGYEHQVLSHNSMHHGVPQSRDRIYVVFWRRGLKVDLELELQVWCPRCDLVRTVRQAWKNGRWVGRYRQQWVWACTTCGAACEPGARPAADIIDWGLPCPRIGDRARPLAEKTRARILAGLQRYGWAPIVTAGAGHVYETTPGNRARPLTEPLPVQGTTTQHAMATPPGFLVQPHHGGADESRVRGVDDPLWTVTASDDRPAFVVPMRSGRNRSHSVDEPMATVVAGGNYGALVVTNRRHHTPRPVDEPLTTLCAGGQHHGLLVRSYGFSGSGSLGRFVTTSDDPIPTLVTTQRPGLLMRNNGTSGESWAVTPLDEPARSMTTKGHQSLLVPYNRTGVARPVSEPMATVTTRDRYGLVDPEQVIDDCGFRMLEPHEIAAAMAFPDGYIPATLTKRDRVKLAGNAVTPPVMAWITGRILQALEAAA